MKEKIGKLIKLSGDENRYQYIALSIVFFIWANTYIISVSLPLLERNPLVIYEDVEGHSVTVPINYTICKWGTNYTISEHFEYSWVSDFSIYCDEVKTGLIGTFSNLGYMIGGFLFSFISKLITHKTTILSCLSFLVLLITLVTIIKNFWVTMSFIIILNTLANLVNYSSMVLAQETASNSKRSIFSGVITIGFTFSAMIYVPLFLWLQKWRIIFYLVGGFGFILNCFVFFILYNSPREYFINKQNDKALSILRGIAKFNGKLENFDNQIETEEYQNILNSINENNEINKNSEIKKKRKNNSFFIDKVSLNKVQIFNILCIIFYNQWHL